MSGPEDMAREPGGSARRLHELIAKTGLSGPDISEFKEHIEDMASANLIHRFESKLEINRHALESKIAANTKQLSVLSWAVGISVIIGLGLLSAIMTLLIRVL